MSKEGKELKKEKKKGMGEGGNEGQKEGAREGLKLCEIKSWNTKGNDGI